MGLEFIANFWWLWLLGTVGFTVIFVIKFFQNAGGIVGDVLKTARTGIDATETATDSNSSIRDRGLKLSKQTLDHVEDRITQRGKGIATAALFNIGAGFCATLLLISIVINVAGMFTNQSPGVTETPAAEASE